MKEYYERLGAALATIQPRNERARTWIDKLIMRCHENAGQRLTKFAHAATVQSLRYDFETAQVFQRAEIKRNPVYSKIATILREMESVTGTEKSK